MPALALGSEVSMTISPESIGPGDEVSVVVTATPGEMVILMTSPEPGPTDFPFIGLMEVGPGEIDYIFLGPFPDEGVLVFNCSLSCLVALTPVYTQAASFTLTDGVTLTGKTDQMLVELDPDQIQDCDGNGVDDDCEEFGDCNMNGIPDVCDIADGTLSDEDGDGIPDDCCPELCKMRVRFTFDGPMPQLAFYLSIWIMVPGTNSVGNRIEVQLTDSPPAEVFSPNGAVRAFNFVFTPTGGLTFLVDYCPEDAGNEFGDLLWFMAHAGDSWYNVDISRPGVNPCDLAPGVVLRAVGGNGSFEILLASENCLAPLTGG